MIYKLGKKTSNDLQIRQKKTNNDLQIRQKNKQWYTN
jgi:hypothetical protein